MAGLLRQIGCYLVVDGPRVVGERLSAAKPARANGMLTRLLASSLLLAGLAGCGSTEVSEDLFVSLNSGVDSRPFLMSSSPVQMIPVEGRAFGNGNDQYPIDSLSEHVDVIVIVPEYYGIPYDIFALGPAISDSHPWTVEIDALLQEAKATGRPLMLYLGFIREIFVGLATDDNGELDVDITWAPRCYDFSLPGADEIGDAFVNYTRWMTSRFEPAYVVNFVESNIYYDECGGAGASWDNLVDIQRRAYAAIKEEAPGAEVMSAFLLETLYKNKLNGWDEVQYRELAKMKYDIFGMATYAFGNRFADGSFVTPYELPADYLSRVKDRHPEVKRLAIAETGWNGVSISVGDEVECLENFPYSESAFVSAYLEFMFNAAHRENFELINWFSFRNLMPDPVVGTCFQNDSIDTGACLGEPWCRAINYAKQNVRIPGETALFTELTLKSFGAMGLQKYNGKDKSGISKLWKRELSLPLE